MKSIKDNNSNIIHYNDYRLHYCGTCKTMGKNYGQQTRLLLKHEVVFLAQLLSAINKEQKAENWDSQYHSKNCFTLPTDNNKIPKVLQYTASINVMLGVLKIEDNMLNTQKEFKIVWKTALKLLKSKAIKTEQTLLSWNFPVDLLWKWTGIQLERKLKRPRFNTRNQALDYYGQPTAIMTAFVFKHGAQMIEQPKIQGILFDLGYTFGKLIYWLNTLEDFEKDIEKQKFNGIQAAFNTQSKTLPENLRQEVIELIRAFQVLFDQSITQLPMEDKWKVEFSYQLNKNLAIRLDNACCSNNCKTSTSEVTKFIPKLSVKKKWQTAQSISEQAIYRSPDVCKIHLCSRLLGIR